MSQKFHINVETGEISQCEAKIKDCPYGGDSGKANHFYSLPEAKQHAEKVLEERYGNFSGSVKKVSKNALGMNENVNGKSGTTGESNKARGPFIQQSKGSENDSVKVSESKTTDTTNMAKGNILPMKGGSYFGVKISEHDVLHMENKFKEFVGESEFENLVQNKLERDGERAFHITVLDPKETRLIRKKGTDSQKDTLQTLTENVDIPFNLLGIGKATNDTSEAYFIVAKSSKADSIRESLQLPRKDFHITLGFSNGDVHNVPKDETTIIYK